MLGKKKTIFLIRPLHLLSIILYVVTYEPILMLFIGALGGFDMIANYLFQTMGWELVSKEERGRWYGVFGLFTNLASMSASLLGDLI